MYDLRTKTMPLLLLLLLLNDDADDKDDDDDGKIAYLHICFC